MKLSFDTILGRLLIGGIAVILLLMPFHAFLTVWLASYSGHYTALRLWKEAVLALLVVASSLLVVRRPLPFRKLWAQKYLRTVWVLIGLYIVLHLVLGAVALSRGEVTLRAISYSFVSNLRFLVFFVICLIAAAYYPEFWRKHWQKVLLYPALLVVGFGLLQFWVLPANFLAHFGYGTDTIAPFIAVDQKIDYARLQSTLRGPNPLGAYLVIVAVACVTLLWARNKTKRMAVIAICTLVVLFGTYSRSAWLGLLLAGGLVSVCYIPRRLRKVLAVAALSAVLVMMLAVFGLRNNDVAQNVLFHTDETSQSSTSSNEDRSNAITNGMSDIVHEPLGRAPGTAGPASMYNDNRARISENYFLQIGQEVGILGIAIFIAICGYVGILLWKLRTNTTLPLILAASLCGLTLVNLLSHAWADDTLSYVWWGFAGLAIGMYSFADKKPRV